jgi:hypothetical protein
LVIAFDDVVVEAPASHGQHHFTLHFVASPHTAVAIDAFGEIGGHVGMAEVFFPVQMVFSFGVSDVPDAHLSGHGLEFAVVVDLTGQAIEGMVGEDEFNDIFPQPVDPLRVRVHVAVRDSGCMARCLCLAGAVALEGHIYAAYPTTSERVEIWGIAEGWHKSFAQVSSDYREEGFTGCKRVGPVVDVEQIFHQALCEK